MSEVRSGSGWRFFLLFLAFGMLSLVLQSTFLAAFPFTFLRVDLLFLAIAYLCFHEEAAQALPVLVAYGILRDAASLAPWGLSIFSSLLLYFAVRLLIAKLVVSPGAGQFVWVTVVSLTEKLMCAFLLTLNTGKEGVLATWLSGVPLQAVGDGLLSFALFPFFIWYKDLSWGKIFRPKKLVLN